MAEGTGNLGRGPNSSGRFETTQWGLVAMAAERNGPESQAALSTLCSMYWPPLYGYVRRHGHPPEEAEDLTQGFIAMLLETGTLKNADQDLGRFRHFLLGALKHYLAGESQRAHLLKHGGRRRMIPLDIAEHQQLLPPALIDEQTPERFFDRQWALTILNRALAELQDWFRCEGKQHLFGQLHATVLALLGLDHEKLTFRYAGRDFRLTDVYGNVAKDILA